MKKTLTLLALAALILTSGRLTAVDALKSGDYVAIIGDSITEQRLYSLFIEDYLLMCQPAKDLRATQFGWSGETSWGFYARMENDCLRFNPTVATTCYGMNDGGYAPLTTDKSRQYRDAQKSIIEKLKAGGVRFIVLGSPGVVDADKFRNNPETAAMYNKTLAGLRDIDRDLAAEQGVAFANVYDPMMSVMTKAKEKFGKTYHLAGNDGIHPDRNGHLVMAYAFLKALGCSGDIGTITVHLNNGKAEATTGHKILSSKSGTVEVESSRYPFCFFGETNKPGSTRGVLEFFPFNDDLNRFRLVVDGAGVDRVKVTWGETSKEFAAADLAKGVNLAAEFLDNPFCPAFQEVEKQILSQQNMEVELIKRLINGLPRYVKSAPETKKTVEALGDMLVKKDKTARDASAKAVKPVRHTLKIEAVK